MRDDWKLEVKLILFFMNVRICLSTILSKIFQKKINLYFFGVQIIALLFGEPINFLDLAF